VVPPELANLSQADLIKAAQRGVQADGDQALNEAARQFQDDMRLVVDTGDDAAFRRAATALGIPPDRMEAGLREVNTAETAPATPASATPAQPAPGAPATEPGWQEKIAEIKNLVSQRKIDVNSLTPDLQEIMTTMEDRRVNEIIQKALDTDDAFRYYMGESDSAGQGAIRDMVRQQCEQYLATHTDNGYFGDGQAALREVLPGVKSTLQALKVGARTTPPLGIGSAPGSSAEVTGYNLPTNTPPERVPITSPGYDEYISRVVEHNLRRISEGA
jgi:hypothetical protein